MGLRRFDRTSSDQKMFSLKAHISFNFRIKKTV